MHHSIEIDNENKTTNVPSIANNHRVRILTHPNRSSTLHQNSFVPVNRVYIPHCERTVDNTKQARRQIAQRKVPLKPVASENSYRLPSLPGISRVFDKKNKNIKKIVWISLLLLCIAASLLQCSKCIQEYLYEEPVGTFEMITENQIDLGTRMICQPKFQEKRILEEQFKKRNIKVPIDSDWLPLINMTMEDIWYMWELPPEKIKIEVKCSVSKNDKSCGGEVIKSYIIKNVIGKCTVFNFNPLKIHGPTTSLTFEFDTTNIFTGEDEMLNIFGLPNDNGLKFINIDEGTTLTKRLRVRISVNRFKIRRLNLRHRPCIDSRSYRSCREKCLEKKIMESTTCRLPFMDKGMHPSCKNSSQFLENIELVRMAMNTICSCPERCEELNFIHYPSAKMFLDKQPRMEFVYSSNKFLLIKEYSNYSLLLLIIDVGGSLGLFIGFSLLTFYEIIEVFVVLFIQVIQRNEFQYQKENKNSKDVLEHEKPFSELEKESIISLTGVDRLTNQNIDRIQKAFWWISLFLALIISSYQVTEIIVDYVHGAPATRNAVQRKDKIQFPLITICPYQPFLYHSYIRKFREDYANEYNISEEKAQKVSFFELMRLPDFNISEMWEAFTTRKHIRAFDIFGTLLSKPNVKDIPYLYGSCFSLPNDAEVAYSGMSTRNYAHMEVDIFSKSDYLFMIFLNDHEEEIRFLNPKRGFSLPTTLIPLIDIGIIIRKNLNIRNNPCAEAGEVGKCVSDCIEKKLNESLLCSLPHLMDSDLKPCEDPNMFKQAFLTAEEIIMDSNITDCKCPRKCTDNYYNVKFPIVIPPMNFKLQVVWLIFYFSTNIFVIIEEYFQLTIYTMFAKICGNLCLYLGFCIPNIPEIIEFFYIRFFKNYFKTTNSK